MSEPQVYTHGARLERKASKNPKLSGALKLYETWKFSSLAVVGRTDAEIVTLTDLLNNYKNAVEPILDSRANSAQEGLQSSILEEFFGYLFSYISLEVGSDLLRRPASSFIGLVFNPRDVTSLIKAPEFTLREKDHDFVLGACLTMSVQADGSKSVRSDKLVVPAVAIECKRYLERNMLDECAGTAERIKKATPYCRYIVAAEFLKLDKALPELSLIDEIYVLRKQRNLERNSGVSLNPIYPELIVHLYNDVVSHLKRVWWDPESGLTSGRVFNLPR
jgi:hypothetical protein